MENGRGRVARWECSLCEESSLPSSIFHPPGLPVLIFHALLPVFLLIALGHGLRRSGFLDDAFWVGLERLNYWVLLPSLFFHTLATATLGDVPWGRVLLGAAASLLGMTILLWGGFKLLRTWWPGHMAGTGPAFTSVLQGGVRFNSFVGLAVTATIFGRPGVIIATLFIAVNVPLANAVSVAALHRHGRPERHSTEAEGPGFLGALAANPLILGCALGLAWDATSMALPTGMEGALRVLSQAELDKGILAVGAALHPEAVHRQWLPIALATVAGLVAMPLITWGACRLVGLDGQPAAVLVFFQALPTATSSYILARQLGGDAPLMSAIITVQTIVAFATMPAVLAWLC